jgi:hypothetical protein
MAFSGRSRALPTDCWKRPVIDRLRAGWRNVVVLHRGAGAADRSIRRSRDIVVVIRGLRGF